MLQNRSICTENCTGTCRPRLRGPGFSVTEVEVEHHNRLHGKTKYGLGSILAGDSSISARSSSITSYNLQTLPSVRRPRPLSRPSIGTALLIWMFIRHVMGLPVWKPSRSHHRRSLRSGCRTAPCRSVCSESSSCTCTPRGPAASRCSRSRPHRARRPLARSPVGSVVAARSEHTSFRTSSCVVPQGWSPRWVAALREPCDPGDGCRYGASGQGHGCADRLRCRSGHRPTRREGCG